MSESSSRCTACQQPPEHTFEFTMAFQPIVHATNQSIFAFEALVRGLEGQSAGSILAQVGPHNRYWFDQTCRIKAIQLASRLGLPNYTNTLLSINFLPNAVYQPQACIRATLEAAHSCQFPTNRIMFEVTEGERIEHPEHLSSIFTEYMRQGFTTAMDDFGAGYSGLNLLATFQPQVLKIDMELTRSINSHKTRRIIVEGIVLVAGRLGITVIAEGIETPEERDCLIDLGIPLQQGFLFARPGLQQLPEPRF